MPTNTQEIPVKVNGNYTCQNCFKKSKDLTLQVSTGRWRCEKCRDNEIKIREENE